ncbi:exonuclease [Caudoviricetes sp.]|nr:exonuclease [Caudoviricetes sp.]
MKIVDFPQGSQEWLASRAGMVTASRIADVIAKGKGAAESAVRRDYRAQIVAEILTGKPQDDGFTNAAMQWGTETEPFARAAYEALYGVMVDQCGLVLHPTIERGAASPDGLVVDGLVEIKCPKTATHLEYLMAGTAPAKYQPQMLWQMACTEREFCDFISFDPRLPQDLQMIVVRFERDDKRIKEIEAEVIKFLAEVDATIEQLHKRKAA